MVAKETKAPLVAVVIPAHNASYTILRTLRALEAQTFRDFHVFVVDDGSTDGTVDVVRDFIRSSSFPIIHIERTENRGACHARNVGASLSKTPLIAFLDADDAWKPQKLEIQVKYLLEGPNYVGVTCDFLLVPQISTMPAKSCTFRWDMKDLMIWTILGRTAPAMNSTILVWRELFENVCGFDEDLHSFAEDLDLAWRLRELGNLGHVSRSLAEIYLSPSQTHRNWEGMIFGLERVYEKIEHISPRIARLGKHGLELRLATREFKSTPTLLNLRAIIGIAALRPRLTIRIVSLFLNSAARAMARKKSESL